MVMDKEWTKELYMKLNNLKVIDVEIENVDMKDYPGLL